MIQVMASENLFGLHDTNQIGTPALVFFVGTEHASGAKHQGISIIRPYSIDDTQTLHKRALSFCFCRRMMVRYLEVIKQLAGQLNPLSLVFGAATTSSLVPFPRTAGPIKHPDLSTRVSSVCQISS